MKSNERKGCLSIIFRAFGRSTVEKVDNFEKWVEKLDEDAAKLNQAADDLRTYRQDIFSALWSNLAKDIEKKDISLSNLQKEILDKYKREHKIPD